MIEQIITHFVNPTKIYILITAINCVFNLKFDSKIHNLVSLLITISLITEFVNSILLSNDISIGFSTTVSVIFSQSVWLLMWYVMISKKVGILAISTFLSISVINLAFIEGLKKFNYNTFIVGAFIYIAVFIYESFYQLKKENFTFFTSNKYLLLFAPVLFLFGMSFVFGFKSKALANKILFGHIDLYHFIGYFVNIIYYTLINIYIYREKKLKHAG